MATGTVMPSPKFLGYDNNGNPLSGGKLNCYAAGTSTPQNTYADSALSTPNANPVILDSAGRATVYLTPGQAYKFVLTDANNVTIYTQDNVQASPTSASVVDIVGTAGATITAGQPVYLSDGSGGKTVGQWYPADSTNTYSSVTVQVGIATAAISNGSQGNIRISGEVTGFVGLSVGSIYYIGAAGTMTTTAPAPATARILGQADSATSIVLDSAPGAIYQESTWTPVIGGVGGTSGQSYNFQVGRALKIGKLVTAFFYVQLSAKGTITGAVEISGLPYTADNVANLVPPMAIQWVSLATTWVNVMAAIVANSTTAVIQGAATAATLNNASLTTTDIANNTTLIGTLIYQAIS